jgi:predicted SAM-dependent methyltransferase
VTPARAGKPAQVERVELVDSSPPFSAELVRGLGARGLNCGCGLGLVPGWINTDARQLFDGQGTSTDLGRLARIDGAAHYLQHDAADPFPFEDECFEWVYAEHFIEHLVPEHGLAWLKEARRMLRPGGLVRITTPDLQLYVEGYGDPDQRFFRERRKVLAQTGRIPESDVPERRGWMMNHIFYMYRHRWIYDWDELLHLAREAGFAEAAVVRRSFRDGAVPEVAALDSEKREHETIYAEILG